MTLPDMLALVYRFHPRGVYTTSPEYEATQERRRQVDALRVAVAQYPK